MRTKAARRRPAIARLLQDGDETYPAMLEAIRNARQFILLETYILSADRIGERFASALERRARAGVEVSVMYDDFGSSGLGAGYVRRLRNAGVRVLNYRPIGFSWRVWAWRKWQNRNHRKQLVVDGRIGFVGGINLHEAAVSARSGGGNWRDTHVALVGTAVAQMAHLFATVWRERGGASLHPEVHAIEQAVLAMRPPGWRRAWRTLRARLRRRRESYSRGHVEVVGNASHGERSVIRRAYLDALRAAQRSIYVTNSYFAPDLPILRALRGAARRGLDVAVIAPGVSDVPAVRHAGRAMYGPLLAAGVKIYELQDRVLHAKTCVVDGEWCTVGSLNLDSWGWRHNLEVNAVVVSPELGAEMEGMFRHDLASCDAVLAERWRSRGWRERVRQSFWWLLRGWL